MTVLFGQWRVLTGPLAGTLLRISAHAISSSQPSLRLSVISTRLTADDVLELDGDHAGELVHVVLRTRADGRVQLSWTDGVTFPMELDLERVAAA